MGEREEGYNKSESGHWNVAADFANLKIMQPLHKCDIYESIAKFGYSSLQEQLENYGVPDESLRLMGLDRLIHELLKLISNCKFAMKRSDSKKVIIAFETTLNELLKYTPYISVVKVNQVANSKTTKINEELFNKILNKILEIKSKINEPLNQNDLIFTSKEDFDPIAYKKQIAEQATNKG